MDSQATTASINGDESASHDFNLDLSALPPTFVLSLHLSSDRLIEIEDTLTYHGAPLTYDASEARLFIGNVTQKRRAIFELRCLKVPTDEVAGSKDPVRGDFTDGEPPRKKLRRASNAKKEVISLDDSSTESEADHEVRVIEQEARTTPIETEVAQAELVAAQTSLTVPEDVLLVVGLSWLEDSISARTPKPLDQYIIFNGHRQRPNSTPKAVRRLPGSSSPASSIPGDGSILSRARAELGPEHGQTAAAWASSSQHKLDTKSSQTRHLRTIDLHTHIPTLIHQTTSEHESAKSIDLPPQPDWVLRRSTYSCERATPIHPPNEPFIEQLKIIRLARTLTADEIGVRAYSTSIAALAAYPHLITSQREILILPGCESKIAALWAEWRDLNSGDAHYGEDTTSLLPRRGAVLITAAREAEDDPKLKVLRLFYDIWGVGDKTARDFHANGWRDLDDVVEFGWSQLSRVQQIGVKYYEEFLTKIPRKEVEKIARIITKATQAVCRDKEGVRSCIVGGYRRGKEESGDVDLIVSHVDESETIDLIQEIVRELVDRGWITHELSTTTAGSRRGQATLPFRNEGGGHGFDTLDKALVVWQDPNWPGKAEAAKELSPEQLRKRNPNIHRRVDIIIAPWSKVGCAVLGWTAGTTFERDLRRYVKKRFNYKFDSSGVRSKETGMEVDLEGKGGVCATPEEAERRVLEGLGLVYREPWERCTG